MIAARVLTATAGNVSADRGTETHVVGAEDQGDGTANKALR